MPNYPTYWLTPAKWSLDTSFDQWSGFNKQVLWVAEYWDEYVFWWDNGTNYYSAYKWVSSINSNKISPFFRVRKDNKLPDTTSLLWGNLNINTAIGWENYFISWWYIYISWAFTSYWNNIANNVVKLNTTDMSFVSWNTWSGFSANLFNRTWVANSKVFASNQSAVTFNGWATSTRLHVFNTDLTVDATLTSFFIPSWVITCIFEQADGKVIISWAFTTIWWTTRNRIVRYNTDWTVDSTFSTNVWTWPNSWAISIKQLSDWKLVLWWAFTSFNGTATQRVVILNTDWTIATAVASWFSSWQVNSLAIDWSNNIYCWWTFTTYAWTWRVALAKLSSTLILDWTYNAVMNSGSQVFSICIDWSVLYVWTATTRTVNWATVNWIFSTDLTNWTLISDFLWWINIGLSSSWVRTIYVDSTYIYIYCSANAITYWNNRTYDWELFQYVSFIDKQWTSTQNLDKFYNTSWTFNITSWLKDWDNLYTSTSSNTWYWLSTSKGVVKFVDKVLDTTFNASITSNVNKIINDNWIIAVWSFTSPKNRIVKLDATGATDAIFDVWTGFGAQADWITKLSNWNYLVTWDYTTYKWVTTNRICVLDNVGTKVWTFVEWTWLSSTPSAKSLQLSNWNYLIYGNMTTYKWTACNRAIILDATGTQVSWLASNFNSIINKAVEHNGKVYFTWNFTTFWATTVNRIACIDLATWTLENIFWTGLNNTWNDIIVDNWGKLVVVWNFTTYNDNPVWYVARIFI